MTSAFKTLDNILAQEEKLGCKNNAVIGGLQLYANNWVPKALQEVDTKEERLNIEKIAAALKKYGDHDSPQDRQQAIKEMRGYMEVTRPGVMRGQSETSSKAKSASQSSAKKATPKKSKSSSASKAKASDGPAPQTSPTMPTATGLDAPVTRLEGIKAGYAKKLARLDIETIGDLLTLYPRRYDDYRKLKTINQLEYGEDVTIIVQVWQTKSRKSRQNRPIVTAILSDGTGTIEANWFNQPWLERQLKTGKHIVLSGRVSQYLGRLNFQSPDWEELDTTQTHTGRLVPIYPLTSGISAKWIRKLQHKTVDYWADRLVDHLPRDTRKRLDLLTLSEAVKQIHFPNNWESLEEARRRLAFDELLFIQLGVLKQRQQWKAQAGEAIHIDQETQKAFLAALPYTLTEAQDRVLDEILADMRQSTPMSRMLQGDVGSGKTVVALAAMLGAAGDTGQATLLAPTEILAEQHYQNIANLLEQTGFNERFPLALLTGSTKAAERKAMLAKLHSGEIKLLVGTHAIIQKDVDFAHLRLAVIDEQHRFGVEQRSTLRNKGRNPDMLVMSATPIPRSLALTMYGDLDLSIIDEMPPGRQIIKTRWVAPTERERAYAFLRAQIEEGRQAFIICPLVEESDKIEAKSAVEEHKRLQKKIFPDLKLGLLHGRMKGRDKDAVMADFRDKSYHILVSTSVVEVGIDIPNASVILIEGANRFGLAQLHQFRGRVGRGEHQSYCLLLADNASREAKARLQVMQETNDGFKLAAEDLKMRGPGEFFGTRQSGLPNLKLVKLSDTRLLETARKEAERIFAQDPTLSKPENEALAKGVAALWTKIGDPN